MNLWLSCGAWLLLSLQSVVIFAADAPSRGEPPWPDPVERALDRAGVNRAELEAALREAPAGQLDDMRFLIENMPDIDLRRLTARFLLGNVALAVDALDAAPWKDRISRDLFRNDILPYACLTETRDGSRRILRDLALPLIAGCRTPGEAARRLNETLFPEVKVRYSTQRKRADQSPLESMESGLASCSGLSILLVGACRAVGVPARVVGTSLWTNLRGNHTWVEVWDGQWRFAGAAEPDPAGLDRGWFIEDASRAVKDDPRHAIYASCFRRTGLSFPLVWDRDTTWVSAVNVTDRYTVLTRGDSDTLRLLVWVIDSTGLRVKAAVTLRRVGEPTPVFTGKSRDESADRNDILSIPLPRTQPENPARYIVTVKWNGDSRRREVRVSEEKEQVVEVRLSSK